MYTVIICDNSVIKDCTNRYKLHLKPFLDSKDYAFCAWFPEGRTLKEAVPDLENTISIRKEWRAVVLADSHTGVLDYNKGNPFDYNDYRRIDKRIDSVEQVKEYRDYVASSVEKALSNPLMKLSVWLAGSAVRLRPSAPPADFMSVEPLSDEYEEVRKEYDCSVSDLELSLARAHRFDAINENFELGGDLFNPPKTIIAVAERSVNTDLSRAASAWKKHTEYDYSNFFEENMYSNKLRCLIYEIPRVKGRMKENDYFTYLSTAMILATNEIQSDILKYGRVYEADTEVDERRMSELCNEYLYKLRLTLRKIAELKYLHKVEESKVMNDSQAEREFESEIRVPVTFGKDTDPDTLYCEYKDIGLSGDCPVDEESYWSSQHSSIRKRFNRFIRQPQRCVEKAVDTEFRLPLDIDNEKAKRLTKYQRQDVLIKLYEEEQSMLETRTSKIYDKAAYEEQLDKADRSVRKGLSQRMSKRNTVIASIIPLALLLIGFLPLFFSELNNLGTVSISLILTGISLAVIIASMLIMLFVFRRRTIDGFKGFNNVMRGIYLQISGSMEKFSDYLSHAKSVMKSFAVLSACDDTQHDMMNIYKKHEIDIENCMRSVMTMFSDYVDEYYVSEKVTEPYRYDYDIPATYSYDIPYQKEMTRIVFLQNGNIVQVPVDYIKSIRLKREELYD